MCTLFCESQGQGGRGSRGNGRSGGNAHQQDIQTPPPGHHHLWNHQTAPPANSYYGSVGALDLKIIQ